jgi:hypothetical protein
MGWPIGLANDGLAQTWYELYDLVEHGKDPDPTPVSLAHLFYTHAHDPLSLVTSMSLRRRRSPYPGRFRPSQAPASWGSSSPRRALPLLSVDLNLVVSSGRPDPGTLATYLCWFWPLPASAITAVCRRAASLAAPALRRDAALAWSSAPPLLAFL